MSIKLVMPSNHLILCRSLLLLPSIFPSIKIFSNESVIHIWWPKYCSFSFSISPSNEYSALISFRIDWFDFLAVQGTLKSLLQHHNSKASLKSGKKVHVNLHHLETLSMYRRCSYTRPLTSLLACHVSMAMLRVGRVTGVWVLPFRLSGQEAEMSSNNP